MVAFSPLNNFKVTLNQACNHSTWKIKASLGFHEILSQKPKIRGENKVTSKAKMDVVEICELWTVRDKYLIEISMISV